MADRVLLSYWENVHVLYPYLDKRAFNRRYLRLFSNSSDQSASFGETYENEYVSDPIFFCILNLALSLGCLFSHAIPPHERRGSAATFYHRSEKFLDLNNLEQSNCAIVQALLLTCLYLQSTDLAEKCWIVNGVAIRVAQSIGLHVNPTVSMELQTQGPIEYQWKHEIRKRLWTGCILHGA